MRHPLVDFLVVQFTVLDIKGINRRHEYVLLRPYLLLVFGTTHDHCIVLVDPTPQIFPHFGIWSRQIDVAASNPPGSVLVMLN